MRIFTYRPPEGMPPIIWEDDYYIAIDKPSGLLSNPGRAENTYDCALTRLKQAYGEIHLIHRLDCDTSGVLVFAKQKKAEGPLKKCFQERAIQKNYHALIWGCPTESQGIICQPIMADKCDVPLQKVDLNGKEAITEYSVDESHPSSRGSSEHSSRPISRIVLKPLTGRTHQLRVHMRHLGTPILGDTFYGCEASQKQVDRLCLHAQRLTFNHPITHQVVDISSPVPF